MRRYLLVVVTGILVIGAAARPVGTPVQRGDAGPLSLVLLIDVSASVDWRQLELPRDVSGEIDSGLLARLGPSDRLAVGVFGDSLKLGEFLPGDRRAQLRAVRAAQKDRSAGLNGPSRIWDAIDGAIAALENESGHRGIIVLTDGRASGNRLGVAAIVQHARASRVPVSVIVSGWPMPQTQQPAWRSLSPLPLLEQLTSQTGGVLVFDDVGDMFRPRHPGHLLIQVLTHLRSADGAQSQKNF